MNDETTNLDQTDEDIFTYTVSDEALEAAAGTESGRLCLFTPVTMKICGCW
jgi:hypothetical protein